MTSCSFVRYVYREATCNKFRASSRVALRGLLLQRRAAAYRDLSQVDNCFRSMHFERLSAPLRRRPPARLSQDRSAFAIQGASRRIVAFKCLREERGSLSQRPRRRRGARPCSPRQPATACDRRITLTAHAGSCRLSQAPASTASTPSGTRRAAAVVTASLRSPILYLYCSARLDFLP